MIEQHYRVVETGEIGVIVPCSCDNPVVLQFKDGSRDAFFLRDIEPTIHTITMPADLRTAIYQKNNKKGRPRGISASTIQKMQEILAFLKICKEPVYRNVIEYELGYNITRPLMYQSYQPMQISLESLKLVERLPGERTWCAWRITPLGRTHGEQIIADVNKEAGRV